MNLKKRLTQSSIERSIIIISLSDISDTEKSNSIKSLYEMADDDSLFDAASRNRVQSIVGHAIMDFHQTAHKHWQTAHTNTLNNITNYLNELDNIAEKLWMEGIKLVALKNAGIARGIYPCPGCCPMGDLDVLVNRQHFKRAHEILLSEGYEFEFRSPLEEAEFASAQRSGGTEYWKTLPNGERLWLELQWRPVAGRWIRPDQEPSGEELLARSVAIPGTHVRLLSPEDNLLQVALHTAKHSYVRAPGFRLHTDVDRIVRRQSPDWDVFLGRVSTLCVKTPVYFSLAIPAELFGTPIPTEVLDAVRPSWFKEKLIANWLQRAGLFDPSQKKFGKIEFIFFTACLYDGPTGLLRATLPPKQWIKETYNLTNDAKLPYYYLKRLLDLAIKRI